MRIFKTKTARNDITIFVPGAEAETKTNKTWHDYLFTSIPIAISVLSLAVSFFTAYANLIYKHYRLIAYLPKGSLSWSRPADATHPPALINLLNLGNQSISLLGVRAFAVHTNKNIKRQDSDEFCSNRRASYEIVQAYIPIIIKPAEMGQESANVDISFNDSTTGTDALKDSSITVSCLIFELVNQNGNYKSISNHTGYMRFYPNQASWERPVGALQLFTLVDEISYF